MPIFSRQHRPFPTASDTLTENGDPLHSRIGYDIAQGVNNLHYTMPFAGFAAAPTSDGNHLAAVAGVALDGEEFFCAQVPTVVPDGMKRFCWTLDFLARSTEADNDYSVDAVNVYITPFVYNAATSGNDAPTVNTTSAFDPNELGGNYGVSSYSTPIVLTALSSTDVHSFVDMSAGTTGVLLPFDSKLAAGTSWLNSVNLVVTMTVTRTGGAVGAFNATLGTLSWQWLME